MSLVTNVILAYGLCSNEEDHRLLEEVNQLCDVGRLVHVEDPSLPSDWFCNGKTLECNVAIGAFNALHVGAWIDRIKSLDFSRFGSRYVQMIVKSQGDEVFSIINVYQEGNYRRVN